MLVRLEASVRVLGYSDDDAPVSVCVVVLAMAFCSIVEGANR